jgi:hypothetical protein
VLPFGVGSPLCGVSVGHGPVLLWCSNMIVGLAWGFIVIGSITLRSDTRGGARREPLYGAPGSRPNDHLRRVGFGLGRSECVSVWCGRVLLKRCR